MKLEELFESVYDDLRNDVVSAVKNHPQYPELLGKLATQGIAELATLITRV